MGETRASQWVEIGTPAEFRDGHGRSLAAGGRRIAVFNDHGKLFAIDDICPHQGASLGDGSLHEGRVICPLHAWTFDLRTGACPRDSHEGVQTYEIRCNLEQVEVQVPVE